MADVLAGPIVRRVEPGLACVWIALAKPAKAVVLEVFAGRGLRVDLGVPLPAKDPDASSFENRTIAIAAQLHVALAVFEPKPPVLLEWGAPYSYDLRIADNESELGLAELDLLKDHDFKGVWGNELPHLALGYDAGVLPSFVLPPQNPKDLRVAHGSCRRHCVGQRDATALLDDLLHEARLDPTQRIHQLLLTGDQVYADAVSPEQLLMMSALSERLIGAGTGAHETIPIDLALDPTRPAEIGPQDVPVDMRHLPASRRTHVVNDLGGGTSTEADSHALGFGEAAALYLTAWANTAWPDLKERLAQRWPLVEDYMRASQRLLADARRRFERGELDGDAWDKHGSALRERLACFEAWRLLPPALRAIDEHLTSADRMADWLPQDDPAPSASARPYHWPLFWAGPGRGGADPARQRSPGEMGAAAAPSSTDALRAALARALTPSWYAGRHFWSARISYDSLVSDDGQDRVVKDAGRDQLSMLQWYLDDLPRVRRVLANTPTLMLFDDHEVTDDWNISLRWARRTFGTSLGRALVRNMLSAYALFQHWGNDPRAFRDPVQPGHQVLAQLQALFFGSSGPLASGPPAPVRQALDRLFDLRPPDAPATPPLQRMHWHFRYLGARHELIALDSRTWRSFHVESDIEIGQPGSDEASPALIGDEALALQVPALPEPGSVLTLVIAAAPFIGMPVAENIVQPTLNAIDCVRLPPDPPFVRRQLSTRVGRPDRDPEPFGFVPRLFEAMLARLAPRRRIVLLSGDVHYSATLALSYWRFGDAPLAARFVQLISSSLRNPRSQGDMEIFTMDLVQQLGQLVSVQSRLGWRRPAPGEPPVLSGGDAGVSFRIRRLLGEDPVLLPPLGLPAGTRTAPVQWAWRMALVPDRRPDAQRLQALSAPAVQASLATDPMQAMLELARRHRWASENQPPRRWQWWTNVGLVEFMAAADGGLGVRQRLYGHDPDGQPRRPHDLVTTECTLEMGNEAAPTVGVG